MNVFQVVKENVTARQAAEQYGFEVKHGGMMCCPFHDDKNPSMKVDKRFHCFGCGAHGDVIDFVARLFNLDPVASAKRLNEDFKLGMDLDRPPDTEQIRKHRKTQEARRRFESWRDQMLNQLDQAIRIANLAGYPVTDAEILAIRYRETMEAWSDILMHGSLDEQMQIFRDREGVERLCRTILNNTQTKSTAA